ncbi:BTB/POZ domain-containing protein kctd6 [Borealophlyctis nickersoniae]|nr:BTB/POZ domain-containing protein kctd6 [Borealophlyctis nickersoniae]
MSNRDETVSFNVGGRLFTTSKTTLNMHPDSMLTRMVNFPKNDGQSTFFIDRDPDLFAVVLNYLRTNELHLPSRTPINGTNQIPNTQPATVPNNAVPSSTVSLIGLQAEALFYNLPTLALKIATALLPRAMVYSCWADTPGVWDVPSIQVCTFHIHNPAAFLNIPPGEPLVYLSRMCRKAIQLMYDILEEKNGEEQQKESGYSWVLQGVKFGSDEARHFLFVVERVETGMVGA